MRVSRWVPLVCVAVMFVALAHPRAQVQTGLYGIGDLAGGAVGSTIQAVTSVNGTIYAVGAGTVNAAGNTNPDVPLIWIFDGSPTLPVALPNNTTVTPTPTSVNMAFGITPDAHFIASQIRNGPTTMNAVRVGNVGGVFTNVQLGASFSARSLSDDGSVVYVLKQVGTNQQAARWNGASPPVLIDLLQDMTSSAPANGSSSADGSVMVGTAYVGSTTTCCTQLPSQTGRAFRYVDGAVTPVTAIPMPLGGLWNQAVAVSADGRFTLVQGNTGVYPTGEYYMHDAVTNTLAEFGSPNAGLTTPAAFTRASGGMSENGVAAVTMAGANTYGYLHNSHGWFLITSALAAAGIDFGADGWDARGFNPLGVRTIDGKDMVFGRARRGTGATDVEGFVAVFPAGFLAAFNPQPVPPSDTSVVGAWSYQSPTDSTNTGVVTLLADGTFFQVSANTVAGFERGLYTWNADTHSFFLTVLQDTNAGRGLSDYDGSRDLTLTVTGDSSTFFVPASNPSHAIASAPVPANWTRVTHVNGSIVGGWLQGTPSAANSSTLLVLQADGTYYLAQDGVETAAARDGMERGTFGWNPGTGDFVATPSSDTNGLGGLSGLAGNLTATMTADDLHLQITNGAATLTFDRVGLAAEVDIDWATPDAITYGTTLSQDQLNATTTVPGAFSYNHGSGSVLDAGTRALTVDFTPDDQVRYRAASKTVYLQVSPKTIAVTAAAVWQYLRPTDPMFTPIFGAAVNGDNPASFIFVHMTLLTPIGDATPEHSPYVIDVEAESSNSNYVAVAHSGLLIVTPRVTQTTVVLETFPTLTGPAPSVTVTATVTFDGQLAQGGISADGVLSYYDGSYFIGWSIVRNGVTVTPLVYMPPADRFAVIRAEFDGGIGHFTASEDTKLAPALTQLSLVSSETKPIRPNLDVTYTATLTGCVGPVCAGGPVTSVDDTVRFYDGATFIGVGVRVQSPASPTVWTLTTRFLTSGPRVIRAVYSNPNVVYSTVNQTFLWSRASVAQDVKGPTQTSTTVGTVAGNPSYKYGQAFTVVANVKIDSPDPDAGDGFFAGIVTFYDGTTKLGDRGLVPGGIATISWLDIGLPWSVGTHNIRAEFKGNTDYQASTGQYTQEIVKSESHTLVATTGPQGAYGQQAYVINVTPEFPNISVNPSGSVAVSARLNGTTFFTTTSGLYGSQTYVTVPTPPAPGQVVVTANYSGSSQFLPSSGFSNQTLPGIETSSVLVVRLNNVVEGKQADIDVLVTVTAPAVQGPLPPNRVDFYEVDADGTRLQLLGSPALALSDKKETALLRISIATLSVALPAGSHRIQAVFVPVSGLFLPSVSNIGVQVIDPKK